MASEIDEILKQILPNMELAEPVADVAAGEPGIHAGKSIADLRAKYLGPDHVLTAPLVEESASDDIVVARVRRKDHPDDPAIRTVIISRKDGLLGSQG
jgi:hypothetical protein